MVTGLPQALYGKRAQSLAKLLDGEYQWNNSGMKRKVSIRARVIPQAMAALFVAASKPGNEDLMDAVGEIDWRTYTTGDSWVEQDMVVAGRSGGASTGVSSVVDALGAHLKREQGIELRVVQIPGRAALAAGHLPGRQDPRGGGHRSGGGAGRRAGVRPPA